MHFMLLFASLTIAVSAPKSSPQTDDWTTVVGVTAHPLTPTNAPADEYFGRFKLSNLGVRNIIHAFAVEGNSPLALPLQRSRMEEVDEALVDWGERYPRDPWFPRVVLNFTYILASKRDVTTDAMAVDLLLHVAQRYPNTQFESRALARLASMNPVSGVDLTSNIADPPDLNQGPPFGLTQ